MMCLQLPVRRGEERFEIDEPIWLQNEHGGKILARTTDLSLSGARIRLVASADEPIEVDALFRLYIKDVGNIAGRVARVIGNNLGIQFDLPRSVERDLLIRKLFTSGLDTTAVTTSVWAASMGMIERIWLVSPSAHHASTAADAPIKEERLPAQTLVLLPTSDAHALSSKASERKTSAA
jgi:cellulose synthase (UDP-forming)